MAGVLYRQRGRFARPFVHIGMAGLVAGGVMLAPVLASSFPGIAPDPWKDASPSEVVRVVTDDSTTTIVPTDRVRDKVMEYEVKPGDTVSGIAAKFGIDEDTIRWENNLADVKAIKPGQNLRILPVAGIAHKVLRGETVYSIAKKYHTDAQAIVNFPFNDYSDPDTFALNSGQTLFVPGGEIRAVTSPGVRTPGGFYSGPITAGKGSGSFIWPTSGGITTYPVWYHMGVDIANSSAPAIIASDGGTVSYSGCLGWGYGCHIIIDHGNGLQTRYAHMGKVCESWPGNWPWPTNRSHGFNRKIQRCALAFRDTSKWSIT